MKSELATFLYAVRSVIHVKDVQLHSAYKSLKNQMLGMILWKEKVHDTQDTRYTLAWQWNDENWRKEINIPFDIAKKC